MDFLEEDEIETGAVNCQTESNLCAERFAIRSYPTIRLINRERGTQQEYAGLRLVMKLSTVVCHDAVT